MSISIPDELKARMDVLDGINWSVVAQEAFAAKIVAHEALRNSTEKFVRETFADDFKQEVSEEELQGIAARVLKAMAPKNVG